MKKHHAILLIILLIIVGNIIYLDHKMEYSPVPTEWGPGSGYGRYYIITHGKIPKREHVLTWQSGIKNYATVDVLPKILAAEIAIVSGKTGFFESEEFHFIFPWPSLLFLPIIVLYFYTYAVRISNKKRRIDLVDSCLLFLFSIFPLYSILPSMSLGAAAANAVARGFFLFLLILIFKILIEKKTNLKIFGIFIISLFSFYYYHHTWSYYLIIFGVTLGIGVIFMREKRLRAGIMVLGIIIIFLLSALLYNLQLSEEPSRLIKDF